MTSKLSNTIMSAFNSAREYLTPIMTHTQFLEKGQLTPEEFIIAGNYLVRMSPSWSWQSGDRAHAKAYLPITMQFLSTHKAPCRTRVSALQDTSDDHDMTDAWAKDVVPVDDDSSNDYMNMSEFIDNDLITHDSAAIHKPPSGDVRFYDVTITYDNAFRTPRVYLRGYTFDGAPLSSNEMLEDVMQDYISKTATLETHPHLIGLQYISIHPCRHAQAMKRIIDAMTSGTKGTPSIELYLFIFLKFIGSMVPTLEYDNTLPVAI